MNIKDWRIRKCINIAGSNMDQRMRDAYISLKSALFPNYDSVCCLATNQRNYLKYPRGTFRINFITKCSSDVSLPPAPSLSLSLSLSLSISLSLLIHFSYNILLWDVTIWFRASKQQFGARVFALAWIHSANWSHCASRIETLNFPLDGTRN